MFNCAAASCYHGDDHGSEDLREHTRLDTAAKLAEAAPTPSHHGEVEVVYNLGQHSVSLRDYACAQLGPQELYVNLAEDEATRRLDEEADGRFQDHGEDFLREAKRVAR